MSDKKAKVIKQIQGLMAKAESTRFEEEADACIAKAQQLMIKFAIEEAELQASGNSDEGIVTRVIEIRQNLPRTKPLRQLLNTLAHCMNCRMYYVPGTKNNHVVGFESDVDFVEIMFYSIQMQQHRALSVAYKAAKAEADLADRKLRKSIWRRNFIEGYLYRVCNRIQARYAKIEEEYGGGAALALRDRGKTIEDYLKNKVALVPETGRNRRKEFDAEAQLAGHIAGDQADISGGRNHLKDKKMGEINR